MPKKRARTQGLPGSQSDIQTSPPIDRMVAAGTSAVTCLLAWIWTQDDAVPLGSSQRFDVMAPVQALADSIPSYLAAHGLLVESRAYSQLGLSLGSPLQQMHRWELAPDMGDLETAELLAMSALSGLKGEANFAAETTAVWRDLAAAEMMGYLAAELLDHQFDDGWVAGVESPIRRAVERLSVSDGFYFCWLAVRDLASAYLRFPAARVRLPETLRYSLESKLAKARNEGWTIRSYTRHARCPESAIAAVFSTVVTKLEGAYLSLPPLPGNVRL